ncbi:MAG: hypothetical protein CO183_01825 [Candidatus Zambryskibacteria bacterium CG_4_9_14_3_um_filter_42_9]|uniref:Uncharacterized protein n=1 Tax=Candidatus Zambryskibacteria bacterium CG22_combo_CG10-13_8_21_14_all_42_17 TaxID=1975118 RepID=A0A2H0BDL1_9BACT|nr:MAG: hypothetical protein COX06_01690 [Candidatus Zambryskibacteria bacterium CG22_combo_CG10-13_8_21_14_all_42_17]PJA36725.1 MAG: hypothetical protein CO183_01825 [Candidatus Zambryskibacteria bacterium CG_4_9_14_3_um_filter_42_9]
MHIRAFLVSDAVAITSEGNKLVIEGIFDTFFSKSFPAQHESLSTVLFFDDEENKFKYELFLRHKAQRIKLAEAEFTKEEHTHKIISRLKNLPIPEEGDYAFEAELNNKIVASYSLLTKKIDSVD